MEKFDFDRFLSTQYGFFKTLQALNALLENSDGVTYAQKQYAVLTAERVGKEIDEGITKEQAQAMINEWESFDWDKYNQGEGKLSLVESRYRMTTKLKSIIEGKPLTKTYVEWDVIGNDESISDKGRVEIKDCLIDHLRYIQHLEECFGASKLQNLNFLESKLTMYLPEEDVMKIS